MKICPNCNKEFSDNIKFCTHCGCELNEEIHDTYKGEEKGSRNNPLSDLTVH